MPLHFDISRIDEHERYIDESENDDYSDWDDFEIQIERDCFACNGLGEGYSPDSVCSWCGGSGVLKNRKF